jgi:UDPglucose--hexose-1-phosphate uridylyltransferase
MARLLRAEAVIGRCYVLTFSPRHDLTLPDMTPDDIRPVIDAWTRIYATHMSPKHPLAYLATRALDLVPASATVSISPPAKQLRYMQIFENKGTAMGCSNPHPHCQIWTTSSMPEEPGKELANMMKYRRDNDGLHMLLDYAQLEMKRQERVVWENASFLIVCPWWAIWPFEVLLIPKRPATALVHFDDQERQRFAEAIHEITTRYDNLFQTSFPYSTFSPRNRLCLLSFC